MLTGCFRDIRLSIWSVFMSLFLCALVALCNPAEILGGTLGQPRNGNVHTIIIHAISGPKCSGTQVVFSGASGSAADWKRFFDRHPFLGIHYIVDRSGEIAPSTPEDRQANHALGNNDGTIGIELVHDGNGKEPFRDPQIEALIKLIQSIRTRHTIWIQNIKGHSEVDKRTFVCAGRQFKSRLDPGDNFPWQRLREALSDPR